MNGTLVRILADDDEERIFRAAAHFLTYQGINLHRQELRDIYFQLLKEQLRASPERYPEFDAVGIWRSIIETNGTAFTHALPAGKLQQRSSRPRCAGASPAGSLACTRTS